MFFKSGTKTRRNIFFATIWSLAGLVAVWHATRQWTTIFDGLTSAPRSARSHGFSRADYMGALNDANMPEPELNEKAVGSDKTLKLCIGFVVSAVLGSAVAMGSNVTPAEAYNGPGGNGMKPKQANTMILEDIQIKQNPAGFLKAPAIILPLIGLYGAYNWQKAPGKREEGNGGDVDIEVARNQMSKIDVLTMADAAKHLTVDRVASHFEGDAEYLKESADKFTDCSKEHVGRLSRTAATLQKGAVGADRGLMYLYNISTTAISQTVQGKTTELSNYANELSQKFNIEASLKKDKDG